MDIDLYCERIGPGFGGEPFNAVTGLAFLAVGLWALVRAPRTVDRVTALALMLVGIASAAQHAWAVMPGYWADLLANQFYLVALGVLIARRLGGAALGTAIGVGAALVLWFAVTTLMPGLVMPLGRAADTYLILTVILAVSAVLMRHDPPTARGLGLAAGLMVLGLPFRILDGALCGSFPHGTHWVWHLFNAAATAVLLATLARRAQRS